MSAFFSSSTIWFHLLPHVRVEFDSSYTPWHLTPSEHLEECTMRVDEVWERAVARASTSLFNGKIANLISYSPGRLIVSFIEYKLFYGWKTDPFLHRHLSIHPLGVSGITHHAGSILVGRRSQKMAVRQGLLELAPSGSIDPSSLESLPEKGDLQELNLFRMILKELEEETGIPPEKVLHVTPLGLCWTLSDGIWDIALKIVLKYDEKIDMTSLEDEYDSLKWVSLSEASAHAVSHRSLYVPLSSALLTACTSGLFLD